MRKNRLASALARLPGIRWIAEGREDRRLLDALRANTKALAYHLAHERALTFRSREDPGFIRVGLTSKPSTQADVESPWLAHWCRAFQGRVGYHRKIWELAFVLQSIAEHGKLAPGMKGMGFACGAEPLGSYLASQGVEVLVTDRDPADSPDRLWIDTGQHATNLDVAFRPEIVDRPTFDRLVRHRYVDMNAIPPDLEGSFDFCWSVCAMEHLGSIEHGLRFVENAMRVLRPGGVAVHTTEFNFGSDSDTVEDGATVLFLRRHFTELKERLAVMGHAMRDPDFDTGGGLFDRYLDLPPFDGSWGEGYDQAHLKILLGGFPCTCFGIIVEKGAAQPR